MRRLAVNARDKRYTELKRSALVLVRDLRGWTVARFAALALGGVVLPLAGPALGVAIASLVLLLAGELCERMQFFAAASSPAMPGAVR